MRAKFINEQKYWDETSKNSPEYKEYWENLVPPSGEAETLQGEVLRRMGRIMYDYYNNGFGNDKSEDALFLEKHKDLFKQYMRNPNIWDNFFDMYEKIYFGDYDKLYDKAEDEARNAVSAGGYYRDESWEDVVEEPNINRFIEENKWDVGSQMDDIMDGIVQYIRLTEDNLEPLHKQPQED